MLLNGRLSARSQAAWERAPALVRHVLASFARIQARGEAGLWGRKALGPMRGWPQNSFLSGSLEAALPQVKKECYKRSFR